MTVLKLKNNTNFSAGNFMNIEQLIKNKQMGIDCTEEESAYIKWIIENLETYFPLEFDESGE